MTSRLIKIKFHEIVNQVLISKNFNDSTFGNLEIVLNIFNKFWKRQEELRKRKLLEDQSLYVNRYAKCLCFFSFNLIYLFFFFQYRVHCDDEPEEETILREIQNMFPTNVEDDFGEFMQEATLEQTTKNQNKTTNSIVLCDYLDFDDYKMIYDIFLSLMNISSNNQINESFNSKYANLEYLQQYERKIEIFHNIYKNYKNCLNSSVDNNFYMGASVIVSILQQNYNFIELQGIKTKLI